MLKINIGKFFSRIFNAEVNSIIITDGKVVVNGVDVTQKGDKITIQIEGDVDNLDIDFCRELVINGNVGEVVCQAGDVKISGNIEGGVQTQSGDIDAEGNINGGVETMSGDVNAGGQIIGNVKTLSGDIRSRA